MPGCLPSAGDTGLVCLFLVNHDVPHVLLVDDVIS